MHLSILAALALTIAPTQLPADLGPRSVTVEEGAQDPAVSPDGSTLAVSVLGKIFLLPAAGGEAVQVSSGMGWDGSPSWSPDGRLLAWAHARPAGTDLVLRNMDDGTTRFIHRVAAGIGKVAFHPDGRRIFFVQEQNQYEAHVWSVSVAGDGLQQITHTAGWHEWSFAISPDGGRMLLESGRYEATDLYEIDLETSETTRVTRTPAREHQVAWAPDGARVWVAQRDGIDRLMIERPEGGTREVFASPYDQKSLALTPGGDAAIVAGGRRLIRVDLGSGQVTPIPFTATFELPGRSEGNLVITGARLFAGTSSGYREDVTIVVRNGRITSVSEGGDPPDVPAGVPVLGAEGRVVMAGLMDNHYHYWDPFAGGDLIARGITAVRDPGVEVSTSLDYKDALGLGMLPGPELFTSGPLLDGPDGYHPAVDVGLETPEGARALVRSLHEQGVDALKAYFLLEPPVLAAVVDEAHDLGLPVTGHLGVRTSWGEAMDAGIDGFNHVRVWRDLLPPEVQPDGADGSLDSGRDRVARMQADWSMIDPDGDAVGALIERMVGAGVALDPTLAIQRVDSSSRARFNLEDFQHVTEGFEEMMRFVARAQAAGVPLLAGTDNVDLIEELLVYQEAGIPRAEILKAATINGARWLGVEGRMGTVEEGKVADLIVLAGDPLAEIGDLRKLTHVIQSGRVVMGHLPN